MKFYFYPTLGDKHERRRAVGDIYCYLIECSELAEKNGKSFEVEFREVKVSKSSDQCRAIHLLCARLMQHLSKEHKTTYSLENVKDYVKREFGYMRDSTKFEAALMLKSIGMTLDKEEKKEAFDFCMKIKQPKSFADATKEEMMDLITEIEAWAASKGWKDVYLESREIEALVSYYDKLKQ